MRQTGGQSAVRGPEGRAQGEESRRREVVNTRERVQLVGVGVWGKACSWESPGGLLHQRVRHGGPDGILTQRAE
jgi:hypothetical protein